MLFRITSLLLISMVASLIVVADVSEYSLVSYVNQEYHVIDQSMLASTYYIVASKPHTLEEGFAYLRTEEEGTLEKSRVFLAMGTLLSAYPTNKYDAEIKAYVEDVERSYEHYSEVIDAYTALAKIGTSQTLEMLKARATY